MGRYSAGVSEALPADLHRDVVVARVTTSLTRMVACGAGFAALLALLGLGVVSMSGDRATDAPVVAGLSLAAAGLLAGLAAACLAGVGLMRLLRTDLTAAQAAAIRAQCRDRIALLQRVLIAVLIIGITVWALANINALIGAIVGAAVSLQALPLLALARSRLLNTPLPELAEN